jgi:hypothetical protein
MQNNGFAFEKKECICSYRRFLLRRCRDKISLSSHMVSYQINGVVTQMRLGIMMVLWRILFPEIWSSRRESDVANLHDC